MLPNRSNIRQTGATVAATDKPLHYVQPNEVYWQAVYGEGRGGIYVSEIRYDDQTKANYLQIGMPVLEAGTRRFVGAVNALAASRCKRPRNHPQVERLPHER